jgi:HK97 family phage portal protein
MSWLTNLFKASLPGKSAEPPTPSPLFHGVIGGPLPQGRGNPLLNPTEKQARFEAKMQWAAYNKSRYLATVVDLIANAASKRWHLERKDGDANVEGDVAVIESFLNCPNPDDTFGSLIQCVVRDLLIHGGCIMEQHFSPVDTAALNNVAKALDWLTGTQAEIIDAVGSVPEPGFPTYLAILPFDQMEIVTNDKGHIIEYIQWAVDGSQIHFDPTEIMHIRHPKSRSKVYGDSPLNPILQTVALDNLITRRHMHVLENDIIADSLFILKEGRTQEEASAFYEEVKHKYTSSGSEGNFLVMASDVTYQNIAQGGKDGEYLKLTETLRNIIAMRYGVSLSVLGDTSGTSSTYSAGSDTAYRLFIENAVRPLSDHICAQLNRHLLSHFGSIGLEYVIVFDLLDDDDSSDVEKTWDMMLRNGSLCVNEVRAARGKQQPVEGGDVPMVYTATGAIPVEELAQGTTQPPPAPAMAPQMDSHTQVPTAPTSPEPKPNVSKAISDARSVLKALRAEQS